LIVAPCTLRIVAFFVLSVLFFVPVLFDKIIGGQSDKPDGFAGSLPPLNVLLLIIIIKQPIAVENLGVFSSTTLNFISELGRRICVHTVDARETSYIFQCISIMLQRFNSVLFHDTLPVDLPDL